MDLLSTGMPLEFEAAKILVSKGFCINSDYTYSRTDSGLVKDFSVDLQATGYTPFTNENKITASLSLLVECKYRHDNTRWLFLPELNRPDFSPITIGTTLRAVDQFSKSFFPINATVSFDRNGIFCYKCTEIRGDRTDDFEFKHGIYQLQYALPRLVREEILHTLSSHPEDNHPFLFCPILLTTADLYVLKSKVSLDQLRGISVFSDLEQNGAVKKVPYVFFYSDYGPDFENHCKSECQSLKDLTDLQFLNDIEEYCKKEGEYDFRLPSYIGRALSEGERATLFRYFTQFVVCSLDHFPSLLDQIKRVTSLCARKISLGNPNLEILRRIDKELGLSSE